MKITAYTLVPAAMEIRPASPEREWMDQTPHKFAYRCLPLSIANASGWSLHAPCDILISWNGGNLKSDLSIHYSDPKLAFGGSFFGKGIVTFHPGHVFRTDDPECKYDLWVTGLPNFWYPFMVPLTGVVETWWLSFTFTMNWKLLQPGTFAVKKGEPLAFLMPVPHEPPTIEASIRPIESNPELMDEYIKWRDRRRMTISSIDQMSQTGNIVNGFDPTKPATHWEKHYFRGEHYDGNKEDDHATKRRFPEFKP